MYEKTLKAIVKELREDGEEVSPPATDIELEKLRERSKSELGFTPPESYERFLKLMNGLDYDGSQILATHTREFHDEPDTFLMGFVEENGAYWKDPRVSNYIIFATQGDYLCVGSRDGSRFFEIDRVSQDVLENYSSFEEMIEKLLSRYRDS